MITSTTATRHQKASSSFCSTRRAIAANLRDTGETAEVMTPVSNLLTHNDRRLPIESLAITDRRVLPGESQQDAAELLEGRAGW